GVPVEVKDGLVRPLEAIEGRPVAGPGRGPYDPPFPPDASGLLLDRLAQALLLGELLALAHDLRERNAQVGIPADHLPEQAASDRRRAVRAMPRPDQSRPADGFRVAADELDPVAEESFEAGGVEDSSHRPRVALIPAEGVFARLGPAREPVANDDQAGSQQVS